MGKIKTTLDLLGKPIGALSEYMQEFNPKTFYHGGGSGIEEFNPNFAGRLVDKMNPDREKREGHFFQAPVTFFTDDRRYADAFSSHHNKGQVYEVKIKTKDVFDYKNPDHLEKIKGELSEENFNLVKEGNPWIFQEAPTAFTLKESGFRGFYTNEPGQSIGLYYPDKGDVRSVEASFDPSKSESGNILAAVPIGALGLLTGGEDEQD
jgi:hypothetical protein